MRQLYCDIDSTINNHWVRVKKWALPSFPGQSIHPNAWTREEMMKDEVLPGALEALQFFSKTYDVHFLTARGFAPNAYSITKEWLDAKGFPYTSINIVRSSSDKPPFLAQRKCDLFIDDFSAGQERHGASYLWLYDNVIAELCDLGIQHEVFKNNWDEIVEKYRE